MNLYALAMGDSSLSKAAQRLRALFRRFVVLLERLLDPSRSRSKQRIFGREKWRLRSLEEMSAEVERLLTGHLTTTNLLGMSHGIRAQLKTSAKSNPYCMLPSFNRALPTGDETGAFLALDVGGSTFRVALVELAGRSGGMRIIRMKSCVIDESVKLLEGKAFFAWMGDRIKEMLDAGEEKYGYDSSPLPMGLSWSFPIDQTSVRSGRVIKMGKGFLCSNGTEGEDLGDLIMEACGKRNLNVRMDAMVNDSSAALLSRAYTDPSTRMSLILGTGTNSAIHFPIHAIGLEKFGDRQSSWFTQATHVIVNTELSMFGGANVLPRTRWDEVLNRSHIKPDYQPLEYMSTGRYLGEIIRLILVEAVKTAGLFGGELPPCLREPYMFDTSIAAFIEQDTSPSLSSSSAYLQKEHGFPFNPSPEELTFIKGVCAAVSKRAAAYLAVAIHSLWCLHNEAELPLIATTTTSSPTTTSSENVNDGIEVSPIPQDVTIACDGTVINKYPGFRPQCQRYLNKLTLSATSTPTEPETDAADALPSKQVVTSVTETPTIHLDPAPESAIFGAAVAVAVAGAESRLSGCTPP